MSANLKLRPLGLFPVVKSKTVVMSEPTHNPVNGGLGKRVINAKGLFAP